MQVGVEILDELQSLSDDKSSDNRRQLLHRITDLFELTSEQQDDGHRTSFDNIMDQLAHELEASVRAEFADRLADMPNAPEGITHKLALDEIDVARPLLQRSKLLSDDFLVEVAKTRDDEYLMAISDREEINSAVTDILVDRGSENVLLKVSANKGANFSRGGFEKLNLEAGKNLNLSKNLSERQDTPADILKTVKQRVAEKIRAEAAEKGIELSENEISATVEEKSDEISIKNSDLKTAFGEIDRLHRRKQLDERMIAHYIQSNRSEETLYALALLTDLDQQTVRHCVLKADLPALAVMCKANNFQRSTFASLLQLRENQSANLSNSEILEAIRRYESLDKSTAQRVMRFLKVRGLQQENAEAETGKAEEAAPPQQAPDPASEPETEQIEL